MNTLRRIPWMVALLAGVFYGVTASHGLTTTNLALTAKIAGWDPVPLVGQPLLWLFTLPFRLLGEAWVPWGLSLFSALTGALTLGLLARSVQLLPWDKPWENARSSALPVLLACAVCGLEFSFWQQATNATEEMLDLLLIAVSLWLLLEYRVRQQPGWLDAAALVWGLGMAENWVMLITLPLFIGGVIWLRGWLFFQWRFGLRLAALGLAGFLIYALLPLANGLLPHSLWSPGQAWHNSLSQTKNMIALLYHQFWQWHRLLAGAVVIYFLVPTLSCLVRQREEGYSRADRFQIWIYRGLRVTLFLACLWLALDPVIGPRQLVQQQLGVSLPLLTFDYLNALGAAFLAGNLLLIAQGKLEWSPWSDFILKWRPLAVPFAAGVLVLITALLAVRNAPAIRRANFHSVQRFGELAADSLPGESGVVFSDEMEKLAVFRSALAHRPHAEAWVTVDMRQLPLAAYRAGLERRHPWGWLTEESRHDLNTLEVLRLLIKIAGHNRLFYLNPSHGYQFEQFYLEPTGAVYEMKWRGDKLVELPPRSRSETDANERFWTDAWEKELSLLATIPTNHRLTGLEKIEKQYGLTPGPVIQEQLLANWYSISLDSWGVALQKQGRWADAQVRLEQALQLNPNNYSAQISLACNTNLQSGRKLNLADMGTVAGWVGNLDRLGLVMNTDGPFDDPIFCYLLGCAYQHYDLWVQAVEQFERTRQLAPEVTTPEFALAKLYTQLRMTDRAQPLIDHLQAVAKKGQPSSAMDLELAMLEVNSWMAQTNLVNARSALKSLLEQHPGDAQIANRAALVYLALGDFTNALELINRTLVQAPDDVPSLETKAVVLVQWGKATAARPVLDHILTLTNLPEARFNRALVELESGDYAAAEADYRELETSDGQRGAAYYGLATIATQRHDTNQAVVYLKLCLSNTPASTYLGQQASQWLRTIEVDAK